MAVDPVTSTILATVAQAGIEKSTDLLLSRLFKRESNVSACFSGNGNYLQNVNRNISSNRAFVESLAGSFQTDKFLTQFAAEARPLLDWCGQRNDPANDRAPVQAAATRLLEAERAEIAAGQREQAQAFQVRDQIERQQFDQTLALRQLEIENQREIELRRLDVFERQAAAAARPVFSAEPSIPAPAATTQTQIREPVPIALIVAGAALVGLVVFRRK